MRTKHLVLATAALLPVFAPVLSHAAATDAMNACVQTFLESDLAKDRKVTVLLNESPALRQLSLSGLYRIEVVAKGRESGKQLARVVCIADSKDRIVAVNGRQTPLATLAAR